MYFISFLFRFACFIVMFLVMLNQGWTRFGHILECDYLPSLRCKDSSIYNNNKNKWKPLVWMAKYYYGTAKNSVTSKKKSLLFQLFVSESTSSVFLCSEASLHGLLYWLRTASDDTESGLNSEQMQINSDHFANLFVQSRKNK